jgi:uncharacterized glyoxalase superfamily protein PhnB
MDTMTPNLFVADIAASMAFYEKLGFARVMTVPEAPPFVWVMMTCGEVAIMLQSMESLGTDLPDVSRRPGGALLLYIKLKKIREFFSRISPAVQVVKGLEKAFYGATEFTVKDPDGFLLTFAEDEA